jgi:hypothetical protein
MVMQFSGSLVRNGQVRLENIAGNLWDHVGPDGQSFRSGAFAIPAGHPLSSGTYRLVLDDGRAGDIVVTWTSAGPRGIVVAEFALEGPLQ